MTQYVLAISTTITPGHMTKRVDHTEHLCVVEELSDIRTVMSSSLLPLTPGKIFDRVLVLLSFFIFPGAKFELPRLYLYRRESVYTYIKIIVTILIVVGDTFSMTTGPSSTTRTAVSLVTCTL